MRAVIDTNVVSEGLTKQGGAPGLLVDAWLARLFTACVSTALAYEYSAVLAGKLSASRWRALSTVLNSLLDRAEYTPIYYSWRPSSPDPGDEHIVDCAMNAGASVITLNIRDFASAQAELGLRVFTPSEFLALISSDLEGDGLWDV